MRWVDARVAYPEYAFDLNRLQLCRACMNPHAHFDGRGRPCFVMQDSLRIQRGIQRVAGGVERGSERITHHLKDISVMRLNGLMQDFDYVALTEQASHPDVAVTVWCCLRYR